MRCDAWALRREQDNRPDTGLARSYGPLLSETGNSSTNQRRRREMTILEFSFFLNLDTGRSCILNMPERV